VEKRREKRKRRRKKAERGRFGQKKELIYDGTVTKLNNVCTTEKLEDAWRMNEEDAGR